MLERLGSIEPEITKNRQYREKALEQLECIWLMRVSIAWISLAAPAFFALPPASASPSALLQLLDQGRCRGCDLVRADLAQAQLARSDLQLAKLESANLSGAQLDGANLSRADLRFASLNGASLRGADLRGALLDGADLRGADLQGAVLDRAGLASAHWQGATGLSPSILTYSELHNAGTEAAQKGRFPEAEDWFNQAILRNPHAGISWLARGISRGEQGKREDAAQDLLFASKIYAEMGDVELAQELKTASSILQEKPRKPKGGNGVGSALITGAAALVQVLGPLAVKAFVPTGL